MLNYQRNFSTDQFWLIVCGTIGQLEVKSPHSSGLGHGIPSKWCHDKLLAFAIAHSAVVGFKIYNLTTKSPL